MGNILEIYDYVWISQNCLKFSEDITEYFGTEQNASGILRYTTRSADQNSLYDCDIDIDLLKSFSRYLNLKLAFILPDSQNDGKLGEKIGNKWVNGSMEMLTENKVDYLCDYAHLEPQHIGEIKATPTIHEIYELAIGQRKWAKPKSLESLYDQFEYSVWLSCWVALILVTIYGAIYIRIKTNDNIWSSIQQSFLYFYSKNISNSSGSRDFGNLLIIIWLFYSLLISESFKSVLLSNLVRQPTVGSESFKELAIKKDKEESYEIYVPEDTPTYYRLVEHANSDEEDSIYFKKVLERVTVKTFGDMHSPQTVKDYGEGKCALLYTSLKFEGFLGLNYKNEFSNTLVQFDKIKDVRFIRKDYEFSDKMVKIGVQTIEAGIDRHWFNMRQIVMPLLIREISPIDLHGRNKIIKVVEIEDLKGHFYVLLLLHIIAFIAFIIEYFMGIAVLFIWFLSQRINASKTPTMRTSSIISAQTFLRL